jgi:hypothetical protein
MTNLNLRFLGIFLILICAGPFMVYGESPLSQNIPPQEGSPGGNIPEYSHAATPGVDAAVQTAQQEIRDPFAVPAVSTDAPATSAIGSEVKIDLQGIGFGSKDEDAYAVIGGDVFHVGEEKRGIKLLEVRRHEVDILTSGGRGTYPLFPGQELAKAKERERKKRGDSASLGQRPEQDPSSSMGREQLSS